MTLPKRDFTKMPRVTLVVMALCSGTFPARADDEKIAVDLFCGPRCVHYVLKEFGKEEPLIEVIRDMQADDLEKGSTLAEISDALTKRKIFTTAVSMKGSFHINWKYPVVIHFPGEGRKLGHFAVWMPSRSERKGEFVWLGLPGARLMNANALPMIATDIVLLTSPMEINDKQLAGLHSGSAFWWVLGGSIFTLALFAYLLGRVRAKSAAAKDKGVLPC